MYYRPIVFLFWPLLAVLCACTGQKTDAVSQHINACLLVTEAEAETAIGTPVSAAEKRSDIQCLYRAKRNTEEALAIDIIQEPRRDRKSLFSSELVKSDGTLIAGLGDAAFFFPSPGGVKLTILKGDTLVDLTITASSEGGRGRPVETVVKLGKTAARRLAQHSAKDEGQTPADKPVDPSATWAGDWYGCHPVGAATTKGHLVLTSSGHWGLTAGMVIPGTLIANKGQWHIDSLQDMLHGTYQLTDGDTFSTTGILSVRWEKIAKDHGPMRFDPVLYRSLTGVAHKVTVRRLPPVEPALVGTWEGSAKYVDRREDFLWLITSNNVTEFYKGIHWNGLMEREGDEFRLATLPGGVTSFHLKVLNEGTLEVSTGDGPSSQWGRQEIMLVNC